MAVVFLLLRAVSGLFAQEYYSGDGGRGLRIAALAPRGENLSREEGYLPVLVQNWLTGGFNRFSAMTVIDRQNQEAVLGEQKLAASGAYSEADIISIGHLTNARYVVAGTLIRVSASQFSLQLAVTDAETGVRLPGASFMKNCSTAQLRSAQVINEACAELLARLGVRLTEAGKKELLGGGAASLDAETSLARGISAQINGGAIEALSYYYQAAAFDPTLAEAAARLSTLSTVVSGGGFGQNLRSDIEARREWLGVLKECAAFYKDHLPFEIGYDPNLQSGAVDYAKETLNLSCRVELRPSAPGFKPLNDLPGQRHLLSNSREISGSKRF
jgi:TolB-like protein